MGEWVDKLLGTPIEFVEAWVSMSNGGLWDLCQGVAKGEQEARNSLQKLLILLENNKCEFIGRLEWFLKQQGLLTCLSEDIYNKANQMVNDFLYGDGRKWLDFYEEEETEDEIPRITLQGLGVEQNKGFAVRVRLELYDSPDGKYYLLPHPSCLLIPQDADFQSSLETVKEWWITSSNLADCPAQVVWKITRTDGEPFRVLRGSSLGGLLAVGIWYLVNRIPEDQTVSVSASISQDGSLLPVSGLVHKLQAARLCDPPLRVLIVAKGSNIPQWKSIRILRAASVEEAISFLVPESQSFKETRERTQQIHNGFRIFTQTFPWQLYQKPIIKVVSRNKLVPLDEWIKDWLSGDERHWILTAPSGMGKTTTLKFIAYHIATQNTWYRLLPVYLRAEEWRESKKSLPEVLEELNRFPNSPSLEQWQKWAELGYLVVLVDQLERVASDLDFLDQIRMTINKDYPEIRLLLATRSEQKTFFGSMGLPIVQLEPLSDTQARELLKNICNHLGKPLPSLSYPLNDIPPFLLVALPFVDQPAPQGQGKLYLQLLEELLGGVSDLSLPIFRIIEILSEFTLSNLNTNQWNEEDFYDGLQKLTSCRQTTDQIWRAIKDRLIMKVDKSICFVHTLLLESLRAYALAREVREGRIKITDAYFDRSLTPLRAILITSLLESEVLPDFWKLLEKKMKNEPEKWAETVATCLNERFDYLQHIVTEIVSKWFDAFERGAREIEIWDKAVRALPSDAIENFVFSAARQGLVSQSLAERRAATRILALAAHKVRIPPEMVDLLVGAFMAEYGFTLVNDLKELFSHPLQCDHRERFVLAIAKFLNSSSAHQRGKAVEAIERMAESGILPESLRNVISQCLQKLTQDMDAKVRSAAQKTLRCLQAT